MQSEPTPRTGEVARFVTIAEAALRVGVSPVTIRRRVKSGELPASMFAGKYRIAVEDVDALVRAA
jgi:excisionase family DNA binding protein